MVKLSELAQDMFITPSKKHDCMPAGTPQRVFIGMRGQPFLVCRHGTAVMLEEFTNDEGELVDWTVEPRKSIIGAVTFTAETGATIWLTAQGDTADEVFAILRPYEETYKEWAGLQYSLATRIEGNLH
jgi:hypothetical protein